MPEQTRKVLSKSVAGGESFLSRMPPCPHMGAAGPSFVGGGTNLVYKDECTVCCDTVYNYAAGIDVCLSCFNGGSAEKCAAMHFEATKHPFALRCQKLPRPRVERIAEPGAGLSSLLAAATPPTEDEMFETRHSLICYLCGGSVVGEPSSGAVVQAVERVKASLNAAQQERVEQWLSPTLPCEHSLCLQPAAEASATVGRVEGPVQCRSCDLRENIWMCLHCGFLGCGRRQFDGSGGNNHAIDHALATGHSVVVKMGTIHMDGTGAAVADTYCYSCDEPVVDPELETHLLLLGIHPREQRKTDRSMAELELEQNLKMEWSKITEQGKELQRVAGPGLTGLGNVGNSCYLAAVVQVLLSMPAFIVRFYSGMDEHFFDSRIDHVAPAASYETQWRRLAHGLLCGSYGVLDDDPLADRNHKPIQPSLFKYVTCRRHPLFSTGAQQDAAEFLQFLCEQLDSEQLTGASSASSNPVGSLRMKLQSRLQCRACKRVRYLSEESLLLSAPVASSSEEPSTDINGGPSMGSCVAALFSEEQIDDFDCPHCQKKTTAATSLSMTNMPDFVAIQLRRFVVDVSRGFDVRKVDTTVSSTLELNLEVFRAPARGSGGEELEMPATAPPEAKRVSVDSEMVEMLVSMGYSEMLASQALSAAGGSNLEAALEWILSKPSDTTMDVSVPAKRRKDNRLSRAVIEQVMSVGFAEDLAIRGLEAVSGQGLPDFALADAAVEWLLAGPAGETTGDPSGAAAETGFPSPHGVADVGAAPSTAAVLDGRGQYDLFAIISHIGRSTSSGHYVAHIKKVMATPADSPPIEQFVLFNDEKVAISQETPLGLGYLYFYRRRGLRSAAS